MQTSAGAPTAVGEQDAWWPRHPTSATRARTAIRRFLEGHGAADWRDTAELLISELVGNAVLHSGTPQDRLIHTRFLITGDGLRVEVSDAGRAVPTRRAPDAEAQSGRGLLLVSELSAQWGWQPRACGIGKTVWFELRRSSADSARTG